MRFGLLFLFLFSSFLKADTITITADEWCPYNCSQDAKDRGFLVDIFTYIFEKAGHQVEYTVATSYEQAIKDVREHKIDAIIGSTHEETPDFIFPAIPLAYSYDVIITKKSSTWRYTSEKSLNQVCLGVIKNYAYDEGITEHINKNQHNSKKVQMVSGNNALAYNLRKLRYKKITALIDDQLLIRYHYAQRKEPFPFKIAHKLETYPLYISFSPKDYKSKAHAQLLSKGIKELQGSEVLTKILKKYGLSEEDILKPQ